MARSLAALIKDAKRALDSNDAARALQICNTAIMTAGGGNDSRLLLVASTAFLAVDPPKPQEAVDALNKACQLQPDSIPCWGTIRKLLLNYPNVNSEIDIVFALHKLLALHLNDRATTVRLKEELIELLQNGDIAAKTECYYLCLELNPRTSEELIRLARLQKDIDVDVLTRMDNYIALLRSNVLPLEFVPDFLQIVWTESLKASREFEFGDFIKNLRKLRNLFPNNIPIFHSIAALEMICHRVFPAHKPNRLLYLESCRAVFQNPSQELSWSPLGFCMMSAVSFPLEDTSRARLALELLTGIIDSAVFPDQAEFVTKILFVEALDLAITLQTEFRPLNPILLKSRIQIAARLLNSLLGDTNPLLSWGNVIKVNLKTSIAVSRPLDKARAILETSCGLDARAPSITRCYRLFAQILADASEFEESRGVINKYCLRAGITPSWALSLSGWAKFQMDMHGEYVDGTLPKYVSDAVSLVEKYPKSSLFALRLGSMYLSRGRRFREEIKLALQWLMASAKLDPQDSESWAGLGLFYRDHKHDEGRALKCFRKSLELNPANIVSGPALCELLPPSQESIFVCQNAIGAGLLSFSWAWHVLLRIHLARKEWLECVAALQMLLKGNLTDQGLWYKLGFVYRQMGKFNSSARAYSQGISLSPDDVRMRYALAEVYLCLQQPVQALSHLEESLALLVLRSPTYSAVASLLRRARFEVACQLLESGAFVAGREYLQAALLQQVPHGNIYANCKLTGDIHTKLLDAKSASCAYAKALFISPYMAEAWYDFGASLRNVPGKRKSAIKCFQSSIAIQPSFSQAWIALALCLSHRQVRLRRHCLSQALSVSGHQNAAAWTAFGALALSYGDYECTRFSLSNAQRNDPLDHNLWSAEGLLLMFSGSGNPVSIADAFERSVEIHPTACNRIGFGESCLIVGGSRLRQSVYWLSKACEQNPSELALFNSLGVAYGLSGMSDAAIEAFRYCQELPSAGIASNVSSIVQWNCSRFLGPSNQRTRFIGSVKFDTYSFDVIRGMIWSVDPVHYPELILVLETLHQATNNLTKEESIDLILDLARLYSLSNDFSKAADVIGNAFEIPSVSQQEITVALSLLSHDVSRPTDFVCLEPIPSVLVGLAYSHLEQNRIPQAICHAVRAVHVAPSLSSSLVLLGRLLLVGRFDMFCNWVVDFSLDGIDNCSVYEWLRLKAVAKQCLGDPSGYKRISSRMIHRIPQCLSGWQELSLSCSDMMQFASGSFERHRHSLVLNDLCSVVDMENAQPLILESNVQSDAESAIVSSVRQYFAKKFNVAAKICEESLACGSQMSLINGIILRRSRKLVKAKEALECASREETTFTRLVCNYNLGLIEAQNGNWAESLSFFEAVNQDLPLVAQSRYQASVACSNQGLELMERRYLQRAVFLRPESSLYWQTINTRLLQNPVG